MEELLIVSYHILTVTWRVNIIILGTITEESNLIYKPIIKNYSINSIYQTLTKSTIHNSARQTWHLQNPDALDTLDPRRRMALGRSNGRVALLRRRWRCLKSISSSSVIFSGTNSISTCGGPRTEFSTEFILNCGGTGVTENCLGILCALNVVFLLLVLSILQNIVFINVLFCNQWLF